MRYDFSIYPYHPFWYIILSEIGPLTPHGISAFGAVPYDKIQTNLHIDFQELMRLMVNRANLIHFSMG